MIPFKQFPDSLKPAIRYVLTDIDDTLTVEGRLPAVALAAMEQLREAGISIIPITGRPAGWCDYFARMWPIDGVVGENGAFYFRYDWEERKMIRRYWRSAAQRERDREKLDKLKIQIPQKVAGCRISADQPYREADLAVDFCEDVEPLPMERVEEIVLLFEEAGARAKISSIHVNGWFGDYDKLAMTRRFFRDVFQKDLDGIRETAIFVGDSPNDAPMFAYFPNAVGVANVLEFKGLLNAEPAWIAEGRGGYGFAEMVQVLLTAELSTVPGDTGR